jgi:hypothetical protein
VLQHHPNAAPDSKFKGALYLNLLFTTAAGFTELISGCAKFKSFDQKLNRPTPSHP